ncbi:T9SS type A sorting domain-containing protein [Winogradskyella eckloniae]|uniref:T9SS type A sorting domain-containing protein n=1 Tax=Winogradskyella eckloniae TaxID=1089306 RepID=UPI0015674E1A|nr:T9SS type A sorting domain-containing protein [Winogradskyella eckloniae]NRD19813.1 T9SS type A sorting domain-containing protein [Winogradskyella eckloniae]
MKKIYFIICTGFFIININAQSITSAEYFIDQDPGIGMGNSLSVNVNTGSINQSYTISMAAEDEGVHLITFRVKDDLGRWSLNDKQWVYVSKTNTVSNSVILAAEYFFDDGDLGFGDNLPLSIPNEANPTVTSTISTTGLDSGIHILYVRVKNSEDTWSLYDRQLIYISEIGNVSNIVAFQYYIDSEANGVTDVSVNPSEASLNRVINFNTTGLAQGDHVFCVRTKNENENWSLYDCEIFTISGQLSVGESLYDSIHINPNPFINTINFEASRAVTFQVITVFDITGKEVYTSSEDLRSLELGDLESGIYILSLSTENEKATFKIVKQ